MYAIPIAAGLLVLAFARGPVVAGLGLLAIVVGAVLMYRSRGGRDS